MKKLYSLLLLGGLLLLGAQNVWADCYIAHNGQLTSEGSWRIHQKPMVENDGIYSITFYNVGTSQVWFRIVESASSWTTVANYEQYDSTNDELSMTKDKDDNDKNFIFTLASASSVTIYYNPSAADNKKVYAKTIGDYDVTVNLVGTNSKLYAFDNFDNRFTAAFPGDVAADGGEGTVAKPYVYNFSAPQGTKLSLIFVNPSNDNDKTLDLYAGVVSEDDMVFSYTLTAYDPWILKGTFDDWISHVTNGTQITVPFKAGQTYYFGIHATDKGWYANNVANNPITVTACTDWGLHSNGGENIPIKTTVTGDYTFTWNNSDKQISVTYPTSITRTVASGSYGTICLPVNATISGANLYTLTTVGASSVTITPTGSNALTEGIPYIFKATANTQTITLLNTAYAEDPEDKAKTNGLQGVYAGQNVTSGKYILYGDKICEAGTGVTIGDNRAYFDITVPTNAPSAFRIVEGENNTTNINAIDASEDAVKFFQNGKLFIKKNGVVYDMMGTIVK